MYRQLGEVHRRWLARVLQGGVRARLFLLIGLALLPVLLLIGWIDFQRYETRLSLAMQTEMEVAQGLSTTFSAYAEGVQRQSHAVGQAIITFPPYSEQKAAHLLTYAAQHPAIRNFSWVSPDGKVLASSLPALAGRDLSGRPYFQRILAGQLWSIGDLMPQGAVTRTPTVAIATAIRDEDGVLRGVVVAGIEPTRLHELTLTLQRPDGADYTLFDQQGVLVYDSSGVSFTWEERTNWLARDTLLQRVLELGEAQVGIIPLGIPGSEWVAARVPIPGTGWVAGARRSVDIALTPVRRGLLLDALLSLLAFILAILFAALLAQTIAGPLLRLERDAQAMGEGKVIPYPDIQAPREVLRLRSTVEAMAAGLIQRAEALRDANEQAAWLARFPDENPNPVARVSADGYILYRNHASAHLPGWNHEVGQMVGDVFLPLIKRAMGEGKEVQQEMQLGGRFYSISVMPFPDERYANLYGLDITERKRAEQALQAYADRLECSNRDLQEFAFMASHDLQEPLRKIDILGDIVLQGAANLDHRQREALVRMRRSADRMRNMVDGLLQYSLSTARGQVFENVDLSQTAEEVLAELEYQILQVNGNVIVEPLPVIQADPVQMRRLFKYLVDNALKFQRPGVAPAVKIYAVQGNRGKGNRDGDGKSPYSPDCIEIFVEDNGIGFDDSLARRLFQPFQRLVGRKDSKGTEYPGIGIGLAICRRIVEAHGGTIRAQGRPGQGTTIILKLPVDGSKILMKEVGKIDGN